MLRRTTARLALAGVLILLLTAMPACRTSPQEIQITVVADEARTTVRTGEGTVRSLLEELGISVGSMDRVAPDLWQTLEDGQTITVVRVTTREDVQKQSIPFQQQVVKSEALPAGQRKLLQLGSAGEEELVYQVILEDGQEVERNETLRRITKPPVDEIIAVGMESDLPSEPISGTIAYISGGNAWMMRGTTNSRRPLTSSGDLDGRVFALSPDGTWLLYSRVEPEQPADVLNTLWIVGTGVLNESPHPLEIQGAIYAEWVAGQHRFVYSTAERIGGAPGWKAHDDVWLATLKGLKPAGQRTEEDAISAESEVVLQGSEDRPYSWWGTNLALSPDGRLLAYGRPDALGVLDLQTRQETPLLRFPLFHTYGEWVWLPEMSWSPDGRFLVCSVHGSGPEAAPEDSTVFDLWAVARDGMMQVSLAAEVGMWSAPVWSPTGAAEDGQSSRIAYGVAQLPRDSQNSRYDLYVMDRDGSNRRQLFPPAGEEGLVAPEMAWSPTGTQIVLAHAGDLYLIDVAEGDSQRITADGDSGQPRWAGE